MQLTDVAAECPRCGADELRLMRSRDQRTGLAVLNPRWDPNEKTYERCAACGFRRDVTDPGEVEPSPRRVATVLGWIAVVLMVVLIAVLTVVLATMLLVVSVWLAVAVPLVVLALLVAAAAYARRS